MSDRLNILVAGGAGFVGSHLCRALVGGGHWVTCVDNLITGSLANIADLDGHARFQMIEHDVNAGGMEIIEPRPHPGGIGARFDVIVNLASPASPVDYAILQLETLSVNALGTWNLLELATIDRARFVQASTSEVYGDPLEHPQRETYWGNVDPIGQRSCYDEGKRYAEALVVAFRRKLGLRASILRIFNTYGPAMRLDDGRVVPTFIKAALAGSPLPIQGTGDQTRSFMFIDDLVRALMIVIGDETSDGLVANVGNPEEVSMLELARRVIAMSESESGIMYIDDREGDPKQRCPDIDVIRARYAWTPRVKLDAGLFRTIEWARGHR